MAKHNGDQKLNRPDRTDEFVRLFGSHARQIYSYLLTLIPNWADAEDVFQETSSILWEKFEQYSPGTNFRAWACQIAYYRALWFRQRQKKTKVSFGEEFIYLVAEEIAFQSDLLENRHVALADCMDRLPERERELVDRSYAPGATIKQAALDLGRTPDAAYKALKRIHRELYDCVEITLKSRK